MPQLFLVSDRRAEMITSVSASLGTLGFALLSGVLTARALGPDARGVLAVLLTATALLALIGALGSNVAVRAYLVKDDRVSLTAYWKLSLLLWGVLLLLGALIALAWIIIAGLSTLMVTLASVFLLTCVFWSNQCLDALNAVGEPKNSAITNTLGAGTTLMVLFPVWALGGNSLTLALLAYTAGFAGRCFVGVTLLRKSLLARKNATTPGGEAFLLRQGVSFLGMNLGQALIFRADQLLLAALGASMRSLGLYSVATSVSGVTPPIANAIGQIAMRDAAAGRIGREDLTKSVLRPWIFIGAVSIAIYLFAPWVIPVVYGSDFTGAVPVVRVLVLAQVALTPYLILNRVAAGLGSSRTASGVTLVGVAILVVAMLWLAPKYDAVGAAWACVIGFGSLSLISWLRLAAEMAGRTETTASNSSKGR